MDRQKRFEELLKEEGIFAPGEVVLTRRDHAGPCPLSFQQRRIWFLQQFEPGSGAYNDPTALRIKGPLNIPVLTKTLNEIIRRHRVLGMNFPAPGGEPVMVPCPEANIHISLTTLPEGPAAAKEEKIAEFVNLFSAQPFDLAGDFPVRAAILKTAAHDYALAVNIHHLVLDGWSKGLMLRELMILYEAFSEGKPSPLGELPIQYTDYVYWQQEWLKGKVFDTQLDYWKNQLAGAPPLLELPTDFPRPHTPGGKGSLVPFSLSGEERQALHALAGRERVTLFMVLMAAYNILLFRYSGQEDIPVGSPVAGRARVELEDLIGLFVNTLVFRTDLSGNPTVKTLLERVRATARGAFNHQDMPFEKLVEELNPQRNLSVTPLFQVMFQLQNAPMPPAHISGLTITPIQIDTGFSQTDLSLTLWEEKGIMKGTFEYSTDLFVSAAIKRMIGHFRQLLSGMIDNVDQRISHLPLLTEAETRQLLVEWNDTTCDYPEGSCIYQLFEACVQEHLDREAVICNDRVLTYARLDQKANQLAHLLQRLAVGPEVLAAICLENSPELIVGVIGILKTGGAYIPMDPEYPDERLLAVLMDAQPRVLITQSPHVNRFAGYSGKILCLDPGKDIAAEAGLQGTAAGENQCLPEHTACVIYTSGSTGAPKGILMDNRNIVNLVYSFKRSYRPGPGDRVLPLTSIASASFVGEILPILVSGGCIVLADKVHFLDMNKLKALLSECHITILSTVPSMIARLNSGGWQPGALRLLLSGGEALSAGDIDHLQESVTIVNGYGLTEATICSTYTIVNEQAPYLLKNPVLSVGKPIINTRVYILDKYGGPVPIGVPGEIYIGGHGLARGYLNSPEMTKEKFTNHKLQITNKEVPFGPILNASGEAPAGHPLSFSASQLLSFSLFRTGDRGCWLADGTIRFLGRIDTQVQVHGYRVESAEIETHLGLHPDIEDVVVTVVERGAGAGDSRLAAYLVPAREGGGRRILPGSNQLRDWLGKRVPAYMIPSVFETLDAIPLNANGKVDMAALPMPSWDRPELDVDFKAPQTAVEREIAAVWQEFLQLEKIGINDNFFDLGGHSLLLTRVHSRLNEMYSHKKELTIVDMFQYPTIQALAGFIETRDSRAGAQEMSGTQQESQERGTRQRRAFGQNARDTRDRLKKYNRPITRRLSENSN